MEITGLPIEKIIELEKSIEKNKNGWFQNRCDLGK
jgi:hypothetical protein